MKFDYKGYDLKCVQKQTCKDLSAHKWTYIYTFYSSVNKLKYILRAEYHEEDFFAVKFYPTSLKNSDYKYNLIINKGDLASCLSCIKILLDTYPNASFGFMASRSYDKKSKKVEQIENNQRFLIYKEFVSKKIGTKTFEHFSYEKISTYLLINKSHKNITEKEQKIITMIKKTYNEIPDLI